MMTGDTKESASTGTLPDRRGVAAIELAFTLPVLTFLSLGAFDVARMLSAQIDYQQAAAEVASLALARPPQSDTAYLKQAAMSASGLTEDKVTVATSLTCNGTASNSNCRSEAHTSELQSLMRTTLAD